MQETIFLVGNFQVDFLPVILQIVKISKQKVFCLGMFSDVWRGQIATKTVKVLAIKITKYSEKELIASLKKNQRDAFEYLYDNYSAALFGSVCRYIPDEAKSADLLQDIFLKIWKNIGEYDSSKGRLFTWMMNITRNTCINLLKKEINKYHVDVQDNIIQVDVQTHHQPNVSVMDLREILEKLRPERKVLLDLVYLQGYTQEEAAEQLAIPLGTAKSRIRVALKELKIYFEV